MLEYFWYEAASPDADDVSSYEKGPSLPPGNIKNKPQSVNLLFLWTQKQRKEEQEVEWRRTGRRFPDSEAESDS